MAPLPGMRVVGEYPTRFDADLAAAQLHDCGLESTVLSTDWAAPHDAVQQVYRLIVRDEVADDANEVLAGGLPPDPEADALDAWFHQRRFADRPTWVRWATILALAALAGPLVLLAGSEVVYLIERLFP